MSMEKQEKQDAIEKLETAIRAARQGMLGRGWQMELEQRYGDARDPTIRQRMKTLRAYAAEIRQSGGWCGGTMQAARLVYAYPGEEPGTLCMGIEFFPEEGYYAVFGHILCAQDSYAQTAKKLEQHLLAWARGQGVALDGEELACHDANCVAGCVPALDEEELACHDANCVAGCVPALHGEELACHDANRAADRVPALHGEGPARCDAEGAAGCVPALHQEQPAYCAANRFLTLRAAVRCLAAALRSPGRTPLLFISKF